MELNKTNLKRKYLDENLTLINTAIFFNVSKRTLSRNLKKFNINKKPQEGYIPKLRDKNWLKNEYLNKKNSTIKIGEILNCSSGTVYTWLKKHHIKIRDRGHTWRGKKLPESTRKKLSLAKKGKFSGSKNPNWKGGQISDYARERNSAKARKWSKLVRQRDNNICQFKECEETLNLHAHHIKQSIDFPELRYELSNGITLCIKHHESLHPYKFPQWIKNKQKQYKQQTVTVNRSLNKFKPPLAKIKKLYLVKKLSCQKISKIFNVNVETVRRKLHELGIKTRGPGDIPTIIIDKDELNKMYQQRSMAKIARYYGCGETVIHKLIHRYKIKLEGVRGRGHSSKKGVVFSETHKSNLSSSLKGLLVGPKNGNWKGGPILKNCKYCNKKFNVPRARIKTAKYCSYSCNSKSKFI